MSESTSGPVLWSPAALRGLRQRVHEGSVSRWRALSAVGLQLLGWLVAAASVGLLSYFPSTLAVALARGEVGTGVQWDDPDVVIVSLTVTVAIAVVATIGTWLNKRRVARRRARMQHWADTHGWAYEPTSSLLSSRWDALGFNNKGRATDVLTRTTPRGEVTSMTLGPGEWDGGASRHAVMVAGPRWFPLLSLTPKSSLDHVELALGGQQITVESHDVNERWRMRCADERFAHEVLHPRLLERMGRAAVPEVCLLVQGSDVVVHAPGPTTFAWIEPMADLALDVVALLPAYLPEDYPPPSPELPRRARRQFPRRSR